MSAKRRKYKFNVIDYLWYMGKDYEGRSKERFTPFVAVALCLTMLPMSFCGFYFAANFPKYAEVILYSFLIGAFVLWYSVIVLLMKYRFTPESERAYYRRFPERTHYSRWILLILPIIVLIISFSLYGMAISRFITTP